MNEEQILAVIRRVLAWPGPELTQTTAAIEVLAALRKAGLEIVRVDPNEPHRIKFDDDDWTIEHPIRERLNGSLFDCRVRWVPDVDLDSSSYGASDDPGLRGVYELSDDGLIVLPYGGEECGS